MLPSPSPPSQISILTYNICWGCMKADDTSKNDRTAYVLAVKCAEEKKQTGTNVCLNNVARSIDNFSTKYDFIALQEAVKVQELANTSKKLSTMGYVHHRIMGNTIIELVTFYNKNRYKVIAVTYGELKFKDGRPYHIILLSDKNTQEQIIFINLHNGHGVAKEVIEDIINNFNFGVDFVNINSDIHINVDTMQKVSIEKRFNADTKPIGVFVAGDFNDHGNHAYWKGITLFKNSNNDKIRNTQVKLSTQPPNTCCQPSGMTGRLRPDNTQDPLYGDYILSSATHECISQKIPDNFVYDASKNPTSDHLPLEGIFNPTDAYKKAFEPIIIKNVNPIKTKIITANYPFNMNTFRVNEGKLLRLKDNLSDPAIGQDADFRGKLIQNTNSLKFPNMKTVKGKDRNEYILVSVPKREGSVGYVDVKFLQKDTFSSYMKVINDYSILRQIPFQNESIIQSNIKVTPDDLLNIPCGTYTNNDLVIVRDIANPNIFGYVRYSYLTLVPQMNGGTWMNSKQDYMSLKAL
jgi:hypothetical protein